jgi:hypothetical protein
VGDQDEALAAPARDLAKRPHGRERPRDDRGGREQLAPGACPGGHAGREVRLGARATFTLNFSTGSAMVLAQYYNFVRFGHEGYRYIMETMQANARMLAQRISDIGEFELVGEERTEQLPLVAFKLAGEHNYDEFDIAAQLAAERG